MKYILVALITLLGVMNAYAQKKALTLQQHNEWKGFKKFELTPDGSHLVYEVAPLVGDPFVVVQQMADLSSDTIQRSSGFKIDSESQYVAFYIKPLHDSLRAMKLREVKKKDLPKDSLGIWVFNADSMQVIPDIKSFDLSGDGSSWLSYSIEKYKAPKPEESKKKKKKKKKQPKTKAVKPPKNKQGATTLYDPITATKIEFPYATGSAFAEEGAAFAIVNYRNNNWDSAWVQTISKTDTFQIQINANDVSNLTWDNEGNQLAYLASADTSDDVRNYSLNLLTNKAVRTLADSSSSFTYEQFGPSSNGRVYFSKNGEQLYFGVAPLVVKEPKDSLLKTEKAYVDVWHYQDLRIQPEQLKQLKRDEKRTFLSVYHLGTDKLVQLADSTLETVRVDAKHNNPWATAYDRKPYSIQRTWEYPWSSDLWWINIQDGARVKLLENKQYGAGISAHGRYAHWYSPTDQNWYAVRIGTNDTINLTQDLTQQGIIFYDEMGEVPAAPYPLGIEGWATNDEYVLILSKNAIWQIDPTGQQKPKDLSDGLGKKMNLSLSTIWFDDDFLSFNLDSNIFITAQSMETNDNYYFMWSKEDGMSELYSGAFNLRMPMKAKDADQFSFRKESYADYPNIWWLPKGKLTAELFKQTKQITNINAQQEDYKWGSVEHYYWTDEKGNPAKGLLYKPENFDSTKAYPLMIYFYEKLFETEHNHRTPRPSYSTISIPFYVSNEYVVLVPDIHYVTGHPAKDAYNSVVSGAQSLAAKPWVDGKRMGIQGQSWGGYQVAALVTQTNLFAAAMAGAPVSNMTSAYGGIRWGSGLSRMFQYEKTQSRIGGTLWDARDLYLENSPIFHLDKVSTPLLIMHNDNDGAVPWYQGIELFMGMRRLQKPAWMLVYNKEEHNLRKLPNRKDLSRRMFEFFNHYLKDDPMPKWMSEGIPATNKKQNESYGQ